jgi:hypothetical protein
MPASYILRNISYDSVAGPIVQMIRVFCIRPSVFFRGGGIIANFRAIANGSR